MVLSGKEYRYSNPIALRTSNWLCSSDVWSFALKLSMTGRFWANTFKLSPNAISKKRKKKTYIVMVDIQKLIKKGVGGIYVMVSSKENVLLLMKGLDSINFFTNTISLVG